METLYDTIEVSRKASKEVIEKAYKTLAKKYHPDVQSPENKAYAEEMMKKINEAYSILSDDKKRSEYDAKLAEQEKIEKNAYQNNINSNSYQNEYYNQNNINENNNFQDNAGYYQNNYQNSNYQNSNNNAEFESWQDAYSKLSKREKAKLRKKIEKEANNEYRQLYERYFRSLGYKINHRWTFKDFLTLLIVIAILILIFIILWIIPQTHDGMLEIYNNNFVVKIVVNIIVGIGKGIAQFFKNIFKF